MPFRSEKQRRYLWKNKPKMAQKWTDKHGSTPVKAGLGDLVTGLARKVFRKKGTAHADSSQAKIMGDPEGKLLEHFKNRYGEPIHAKKGKYQKLEHPDHEIKPIEHKEENVSSKERVEKLLDERKTKKETKKKLVKQGPAYVPGWRPNLSVRATEGGPIKAKKGIGLPPATKYKKYLKGLKKATTTPLSGMSTGLPPKTARLLSQLKFAYKDRNTSKFLKRRFKLAGNLSAATKAGTSAKVLAKMSKTVGSFPDAASAFTKTEYEKLVNAPLKRKFNSISLREQVRNDMTPADVRKKLDFKSSKVFKVGKDKYRIPSSPFLQRRFTLAGARNLGAPKTALAVLKKLGRRTAIGKAVAAATVVAGAYEAGKRKLFTKDKKKVTKKSIGGETVVMKSGGGYIDDLL